MTIAYLHNGIMGSTKGDLAKPYTLNLNPRKTSDSPVNDPRLRPVFFGSTAPEAPSEGLGV